MDLEAAREAIHRAESALHRSDRPGARGASLITLFAACRGFLPCEEREWISVMRAYHDLVRRLRDELGVGPSEASRTLHGELLAQH